MWEGFLCQKFLLFCLNCCLYFVDHLTQWVTQIPGGAGEGAIFEGSK